MVFVNMYKIGYLPADFGSGPFKNILIMTFAISYS